jgi:hypothetical protein
MSASKNSEYPFNGGKMNSLFELVTIEEDGVPKWRWKTYYGADHVSEAAARALAEGPAWVKIHGECSLLILEGVEDSSDEEYNATEPGGRSPLKKYGFYMRRDRYKKKKGDLVTDIPEGVQPATFMKHEYSLLRLDENLVTGKGKKKSRPGPETYAAIERGIGEGAIPDPNSLGAPQFISVEWVGRKHQGNVDDIDADHAIAVHSAQIYENPPRTREALEELAMTERIEGLVYMDPETGERFKFKFEVIEGSPAGLMMSGKAPAGEDKTTVKAIVVGP